MVKPRCCRKRPTFRRSYTSANLLTLPFSKSQKESKTPCLRSGQHFLPKAEPKIVH